MKESSKIDRDMIQVKYKDMYQNGVSTSGLRSIDSSQENWQGWQLVLFTLHLLAPLLGITGLAWYAQSQASVAVNTDLSGWVALWSGMLIVSLGDRVTDRRLPLSHHTRRSMVVVCVGAMAVGLAAWWQVDTQRKMIMAGLGLMALCYPLAQRFVLAKTCATALAWTVSALCLPVDLVEAPLPSGWRWSQLYLLYSLYPFWLWWQMIAFVAAAALLCDVKDIIRDRGVVRSAWVVGGPRLHYTTLVSCLLVAALPLGASGAWSWSFVSCWFGLVLLVPCHGFLQRPLLAPLAIDTWLVVCGLSL